MTEKSNVWFPAKTYGYGWGLPCNWQGWIVFLTYVLLLILGSIWVNPAKHLKWWYAFVVGLSLALCFVCWLKGEKPAWRWGNKKESSNQPSDHMRQTVPVNGNVRPKKILKNDSTHGTITL